MAMVGATTMVAMAAPPLLAPLAVLVEVVVARRRHHACAHVCQVLMCVLCHAMLHARALRALAPSDAHASRVGERLRVSMGNLSRACSLGSSALARTFAVKSLMSKKTRERCCCPLLELRGGDDDSGA